MNRRRIRESRKQSGIALIALLVLLILAGSYAFYRSVNVGFGGKDRDAALMVTLARAKDSLIAYAVMDSKRPGRLLCPDLLGDGISPLLSRDDCDAYAGWLPWKTLDLKEATDDYGTRLRYVALRWFGGDRAMPPLNSETLSLSQLAAASISKSSLDGISLGTLYLDIPVGNGTDATDPTIDPKNDIVALIIAPRGELDARNADSDNYFFSGKSSSDPDNDVIMPVTRQELMAAVEKRVANEVKACLEGHASSSLENPAQTYPWPAPLSSSTFKGTAQSLFGMIPATQPGGNPDIDLKQTISNLTSAQNTLTTAMANTDLAAAQQALAAINEIAGMARAQFDRLFLVAETLYKSTKKEITVDDNTILISIFSDIGDAPDNVTIAAERPRLAIFKSALSDNGFDVFLAELSTQNQNLAQAINAAASSPSYDSFDALQSQANLFRRKIYGYSITPNPEITQAITVASPIATDARDNAAIAKNLSDYTTEPNITKANAAISRANDLFNANTVIYNTVLASRVNVDASEFRYLALRAGTFLAAYSAAPDMNSLDALAVVLNGALQSVNAVSTGSTTVLAAKAAAVGALNATLPPNTNTVVSLSNVAITRIDALATAIENNGDNVLLETLKIADSRLAQAISGSLDAATLKNTIDGIVYWATQTATYANDIARKARKRVNLPATSDSGTSAYTRSGQLLDSLDGSRGSIALLNDYIQAPGDTAKAAEAQTAVSATQTALARTIGSASTLEAILESGTAQAASITQWYGNACAFLRPAVTPSWWAANNWANTTFYQISDRVRPATGKLTVNGNGEYRVVVVASGRALEDQNRAAVPRTTRNYLECADPDQSPPQMCNRTPSRDESATAPDTRFWGTTPSSKFNDRLAY
jgi:hypothetical protein